MAEKAKRLRSRQPGAGTADAKILMKRVLEVRVYSYSKLVGVEAATLNSCEHYDFVLGF